MWEFREQYDLDKLDYESARKLYLDAQKAWDDNQGRMYNLVLQHCSKELEVKLRALAEWPAVNAQREVIKLLMMVLRRRHSVVTYMTISQRTEPK